MIEFDPLKEVSCSYEDVFRSKEFINICLRSNSNPHLRSENVKKTRNEFGLWKTLEEIVGATLLDMNFGLASYHIFTLHRHLVKGKFNYRTNLKKFRTKFELRKFMKRYKFEKCGSVKTSRTPHYHTYAPREGFAKVHYRGYLFTIPIEENTSTYPKIDIRNDEEETGEYRRKIRELKNKKREAIRKTKEEFWGVLLQKHHYEFGDETREIRAEHLKILRNLGVPTPDLFCLTKKDSELPNSFYFADVKRKQREGTPKLQAGQKNYVKGLYGKFAFLVVVIRELSQSNVKAEVYEAHYAKTT